MENDCPVSNPNSLVDRAISRTFFCDPLHTLQYSGIAWPKVYIEQFSLSPRKKKPENAHHPGYKSRKSEGMQGVAKKSCFEGFSIVINWTIVRR